MGADFIGIGRPAIYGLICNGFLGVRNVFKILNNEFNTTMINGGFNNLKSFNQNRIKFSEKNKNKIICIIPARGGSKGIKLKNLRKVCGKPLIYYPIAAAKKQSM